MAFPWRADPGGYYNEAICCLSSPVLHLMPQCQERSTEHASQHSAPQQAARSGSARAWKSKKATGSSSLHLTRCIRLMRLHHPRFLGDRLGTRTDTRERKTEKRKKGRKCRVQINIADSESESAELLPSTLFYFWPLLLPRCVR